MISTKRVGWGFGMVGFYGEGWGDILKRIHFYVGGLLYSNRQHVRIYKCNILKRNVFVFTAYINNNNIT